MRYPFRTRSHAAGFIILLVFFLIFPIILSWGGHGDRSEVYRAVPPTLGPMAAIERQIFQEKGDIDILFLGDSLLREGVDIAAVREALSRKLGRPATVFSFGCAWPGLDRHYFLLRDLLAHRKVKMVVMCMPTPRAVIDKPHVMAFRWLFFGEDNEAFQGLGLRDRAALYVSMILGAPHKCLTLLRTNLVAPEDCDISLLDGHKLRRGFNGAPFVATPPRRSDAPPESLIYSASTQDNFRFVGPPLASLQRHFALLLADLLRTNRVTGVVLHIPREAERNSGTVDERENWPAVLGKPIALVGIAPKVLFQGLDGTQIDRYYYDEHFNINGNEFFTTAITPALTRLYADSVK